MNDPTPVERLCYLRDCPLVAIANHTKKRPNDLTIGRLYNHHMLDLVQFEVSNYAPLSSFTVEKSASGSKPCFVLSGEAFNTSEDMKTIGNVFVDFFRGQQVDQINLQGLDHVIILTANDDKTILFRHYRIKLKKSGTKVSRLRTPLFDTCHANSLCTDTARGARRDGTAHGPHCAPHSVCERRSAPRS